MSDEVKGIRFDASADIVMAGLVPAIHVFYAAAL